MTTENVRTRWPLNLVFQERGIRLGEEVLEQSKLFRANQLRLFCGVKLSELHSSVYDEAWYRAAGEIRYDYLICREDQVLLGLRLTDREPQEETFFAVPDLPVVGLTMDQMALEQVDEVLTSLQEVLNESAQSVWHCRLAPCPPELTKPLLREVLLETQSNGDIAPTEYGMDNGLVRVWQNGRARAFCSPETVQHLSELLASEPPWAAPHRDRISFDDRLSAYRSGLSCNAQTSAELVRKVMDLPLAEYMDGFPEELKQLQCSLPGECGTYAEAARGISHLLHSPVDDLYDQGVVLMRNLAVPPLDDENIKNGIRLGRSALGRLPDRLPERYLRTEAVGEPQCFDDHVSAVRRKLPVAVHLAFAPQEQFFQGVGVLAESRYPQWRSLMLRRCMELPARYRYVDLLRMADYEIQQGDEDSWDTGTWLFYLLLIEPYCLMFQRKEQKQHTSRQKEVKKHEL